MIDEKVSYSSRINYQLMDDLLQDRILSLEFLDFFLGKYLGSGISRHVYEFALDPKWVIKLEHDNLNANSLEFHVWQRVQYTNIAKWFAPVKMMSRCGRVLMMKRAQPVPVKDIPLKVPHFFTDICYDNFGMIGNQIVSIDYASNLLMEKGMKPKIISRKSHR